MAARSIWEVIGGAEKGGILVREEKELSSPQNNTRLGTGSLVEELELLGDRLHYKKVSGYGPQEGWVSIKISGKALLTVSRPAASGPNTSGQNAIADPVFAADKLGVPRLLEASVATLVGEAYDQMVMNGDVVDGTLVGTIAANGVLNGPSRERKFQARFPTQNKVKLRRLDKSFNMNGKNGQIYGFDPETGQYVVKVIVLTDRNIGLKQAATIIMVRPDHMEVHADQLEKDKVLNGDEIVLLGAGDAKRALYEVQLDPQYWYDKAIERVFDAKNDFAVLDLDVPTVPIEDMALLKRQYRKISLAVHPDKNSHPQATDAFRKVYGAFETLMDVKQQRRLLWIMGKLDKSLDEQCTFEEDEEDELFQWWWEATVSQIEKQAAEFEGQRYDDFGAMWISDGLGGKVEDVGWVGLETAKRLHKEKGAIFIDCRDFGDFTDGHILGAWCTPLPDIIDYGLTNVFPAELISLILMNRKLPIIIYSEVATPFSRCRAFCRWLLRAGHHTLKAERLRRLRGGLFGWKHKGGPMMRPLEGEDLALQDMINIKSAIELRSAS